MKSTKTMLIAALALGALLAGGSPLLAQDTPNNPPAGGPPAGGPPGGGMRGRGGPSIEMLTTNLSLTAEQVPKVKAVLDDQRTKMGELRNETDQEARRTKMQELRKETTEKMKAILTPEQFAKYEKMMPGMRGNRPPGGGGGGGGAGAGGPPAGDTPPPQK